MNRSEARSDPFGLGAQAFAEAAARSDCPFSPEFSEGRHWLLGWDYGRSRAATRQFPMEKEGAL
jgi:hypothetical protein